MYHATPLRCFAVLVLFTICAKQLTGTGGLKFRWKKKDSRIFVKGYGSKLEMEPGDTIVRNLIPINRPLFRPFRVHYAVTETTILQFTPANKLITLARWKLVNIREKLAKAQLENRGKKEGHIGPVGSLIAVLMTKYDKPLPFNVSRCYGKHYTEYLSLGKVKGSRMAISFLPPSRRCPVKAQLDRSMFEKIYHDKHFTLENGAQEKFHLTIDEWPDFIHDLRQRVVNGRLLKTVPHNTHSFRCTCN